MCISFVTEIPFIKNCIFINFKQQMKMKRRSNAKTQEKTKLQKLFPIQKKLLNLYNALLQASSFSNDEFYNDFNINDKRNCEQLIPQRPVT